MNETLAFALGMAGVVIVIALLLAQQSTPDTAEREHDDSTQP